MNNFRIQPTKESFLFFLDKIAKCELYKENKNKMNELFEFSDKPLYLSQSERYINIIKNKNIRNKSIRNIANKTHITNNKNNITNNKNKNSKNIDNKRINNKSNLTYLKPENYLYNNIIKYVYEVKNNIKQDLYTFDNFHYNNHNHNNSFFNDIKHDSYIYYILDNIFKKCFSTKKVFKKKYFVIEVIQLIEKNRFIENNYKNKLICLLYKTYRIAKLFSLKVINYKKSLFKIYNTHDLMMNSVDDIPLRKKYILYQNNTQYIFNIDNLIKMIKNKLLYLEYFKPSPNVIKNPYTNVVLTTCELYKLYFYCLYNYVNIPLCLSLYMNCGFKINKLKIVHSPYLQIDGLEQSYNSYTIEEKIYYMNEMFGHYEFRNYINNTLLNYYYSNEEKIIFLNSEILNFILYNYCINEYYADYHMRLLKQNLTLKNIELEKRIV